MVRKGHSLYTALSSLGLHLVTPQEALWGKLTSGVDDQVRPEIEFVAQRQDI